MRIEQAFVKKGYFWLPDTPEKKIPGTLTIEDGGRIELEIVGYFHDDIESMLKEDTFDKIVGEIEHDGYITLDHCFYLQKNIFGSSISKSTLHVHRALSGIAYDKDEEVTFNSVSFSMDCLDEWIHISGFSVETVLEYYVTTIRYIPPEQISFSLTNGMELEIGFSHTIPSSGANITEAKITQKAYFNLKSEELRPLDDFVKIIYRLTHLICFATDEIVTIKNLKAKSINIQREVSADKKVSMPIALYYASLPYTEKTPKKSWNLMLFTFKTIEYNAQSIFNAWIDAYDTLSPAFNLYFATKTNTKKYLEEQFLGLIQGLETYHRRSSHETLMVQDKFDVLVTEIKSHCPQEYLEWLDGCLKYGNEISLKTRLRRVMKPFQEKLGNSKNREKLLQQIVDTRNYLTHYSVTLKDKTAQGEELWRLCEKLEALFQLHFLKLIGFSDEEINTIVSKSYSLQTKLSH